MLSNNTWILLGVVLIVLAIGIVCIVNNPNLSGKSPEKLPDPETGIHLWMNAMNTGNGDRLYDLAPDEIKEQMTLVQFQKDNLNNAFTHPGYVLNTYHVIDKIQNGTYAQIVAEVYYQQTGTGGKTEMGAPIWYTFDLFYEHGEWKLWADSESGLQGWLAAVNARDLDRVYDLAPDAVKQQISLTQFKEKNVNNSFLQPGNFYSDYTILDKEQNATYSQIKAEFFYEHSANQGNTSQASPIFYRFGLYHEHGEWKIWELSW